MLAEIIAAHDEAWANFDAAWEEMRTHGGGISPKILAAEETAHAFGRAIAATPATNWHGIIEKRRTLDYYCGNLPREGYWIEGMDKTVNAIIASIISDIATLADNDATPESVALAA